jgi:hypothetical protein
VVNVRAAALRTWAFPTASPDAAALVAQLRGDAGPDPPLPFAAPPTAHPALLYREFSQRADGAARVGLSAELAGRLDAVLALYAYLRGAAP